MRQLAAPALLTLLAFSSVSQAETVEMSDSRMKLFASPEQNRFEITDRRSGKAYIKNPCPAAAIERIEKRRVEDPVWGQGQEMLVAWVNGWETSLRLFESCPFAQIQTTVCNRAPEPLVTASLELFRVAVDLGVPPDELRSYGTGFLNDLAGPVRSFSFTALVDPETRNGVVAAQLTHERSSGVFTTQLERGKPVIHSRLDFGRFQVAAGKMRATDTLLVGYFDDARLGLEAYAEAVVRQDDIRLRPEPAVYCTWYHARASNEGKFGANVEFAERQLKPFGLSVMQIDDGWQLLDSGPLPEGWDPKKPRGRGPVKEFVRANENFPSGMAHTAEKTARHGLVPGIWFMPFAGDHHTAYFADKQDLFAHWPDGEPIEDKRWSGSLLDLTNPKTQQFVHDRCKRIYNWGYRYFKLDGMHTGAVTYNVYVNTDWRTSGLSNTRNFIGTKQLQAKIDSDSPSTALFDPGKTHIEAYRIGLDQVRKAAPEAYILGCNVSQNMRSMGAAFGKIDAMRIGPDNGGGGRGDWNGVVTGARHGTNLYFLNDRVWRNDPDPVYVRASNPIESARLMVSWVAVTGSMLSVSEQFADLQPERLDLLKRTMPGHDLKPRPVDLFESPIARIWLLTDTRRRVRRNLIGLFNWNENRADTIRCGMGRIGLDPHLEYVGFDFWANRFAGSIRGTLQEHLPAGTCRVLAVCPAADHPQLLSTSRHITQGMVDVLEENWDAGTRTLSGRSVVVAGDPYELRIALPASGDWRVARAEAGEESHVTIGQQTDRGVRVTIHPKESRTVCWKAVFVNGIAAGRLDYSAPRFRRVSKSGRCR
jgi:hypothetical protein